MGPGARWRCPASVVILSVADLNMPVTLVLAWRKDNMLIAEVRRFADVQALK
jgi:hypothetical protein